MAERTDRGMRDAASQCPSGRWFRRPMKNKGAGEYFGRSLRSFFW
jgi:hypothetical protein